MAGGELLGGAHVDDGDSAGLDPLQQLLAGGSVSARGVFLYETHEEDGASHADGPVR